MMLFVLVGCCWFAIVLLTFAVASLNEKMSDSAAAVVDEKKKKEDEKEPVPKKDHRSSFAKNKKKRKANKEEDEDEDEEYDQVSDEGDDDDESKEEPAKKKAKKASYGERRAQKFRDQFLLQTAKVLDKAMEKVGDNKDQDDDEEKIVSDGITEFERICTDFAARFASKFYNVDEGKVMDVVKKEREDDIKANYRTIVRLTDSLLEDLDTEEFGWEEKARKRFVSIFKPRFETVTGVSVD